MLCEAEGTVCVPAAWAERIGDPRAPVDDDVVDVPVLGDHEIPTPHAKDYPAVATRIPADAIHRDDRRGRGPATSH